MSILLMTLMNDEAFLAFGYHQDFKEDGWIKHVNCLYEDRWDTIRLKYQQIS